MARVKTAGYNRKASKKKYRKGCFGTQGINIPTRFIWRKYVPLIKEGESNGSN